MLIAKVSVCVSVSYELVIVSYKVRLKNINSRFRFFSRNWEFILL